MASTRTKGQLVTKPDLARILGLSSQRVAVLIKEGMPYEKQAKKGEARWEFNTHDVIQWLVAREKDKILARTTGAATLTDEKRRHTSAAATLKEIELAQKRGSIVNIEDVGDVWERMCSDLRSRIMAVPGRIAQECASKPAAAIERILKKEVSETLSELSSYNAGT